MLFVVVDLLLRCCIPPLAPDYSLSYMDHWL